MIQFHRIEILVVFLVEGEKFKGDEICLRGLHLCFFHSGELVLFWNTTEKVKFLKGVRYMILSITVKQITFWNGNLIYVIRNVSFTFYFMLTLTLEKLLENGFRFETDVVLGIFCLSRFHLRERTHDAGSVTRFSFQDKLMVLNKRS